MTTVHKAGAQHIPAMHRCNCAFCNDGGSSSCSATDVPNREPFIATEGHGTDALRRTRILSAFKEPA